MSSGSLPALQVYDSNAEIACVWSTIFWIVIPSISDHWPCWLGMVDVEVETHV